MRVLGIDAGFASLGWGVLEDGKFVACGVIRTEKDHDVTKAADSQERAGEIWNALVQVEFLHGPFDRLHCEGISWTRDAKVTGKMGITWGLIFGLATLRGWVVNQFPPKTLKYRLTGSANASKKVVEMAVVKLLPLSASPLVALKGQREHAADALGAALWGEAYLRQKSG